ncbi:sensor histidine kinase [Christiangramia salexigens]|uniref:histidine kinase n=1 Tax=Christiangramia salexigens TaxID=1913577 RepID=A0A1L3J250_9FLAO|nr:ATP-binding protein [Christiangramia salexigens]APG59197.1 histidine kinase [Christiangramia salexigens]
MLRKEEILLIVYFILVILFLAGFSVLFFITYQRRKNKILREKYDAEQQFKTELANARIEIQEATLKNVSWELHDNIGQLLSIATMQLNLLSRKVLESNTESLEEAKKLVSDSLSEVRSLSRSLNAEVVDHRGLVSSVENEIDRFNRMGVLEASAQIEGEIFEIPQGDMIILFRILQEFFSNVIKHSGASELKVKIEYLPNSLKISALDNGKGYNPEALQKGSGLLNMKGRAEMIQAEFELNSSEGNGTSLYLHYPTKKN